MAFSFSSMIEDAVHVTVRDYQLVPAKHGQLMVKSLLLDRLRAQNLRWSVYTSWYQEYHLSWRCALRNPSCWYYQAQHRNITVDIDIWWYRANRQWYRVEPSITQRAYGTNCIWSSYLPPGIIKLSLRDGSHDINVTKLPLRNGSQGIKPTKLQSRDFSDDIDPTKVPSSDGSDGIDPTNALSEDDR